MLKIILNLIMPSPSLHHMGLIAAERKVTIACVESATAGRLCSEIALLASSGEILIGGLVCYDANLKEQILGVPKEMLEKYTPESAEITEELACRLHKLISADIYVAITGLITPGGSENPDKPVGTMFIHVLYKNKSFPVRQVFSGSPEQIMLQSIDRIAELVIDILENQQ